MATYEYRCPSDGDFELRFPIGRAPQRAACPTCGDNGPRVFRTAPGLNRTPRPLAAAIDRAEKSAEEPEVVSSIPPRRPAPRRPPHPAHARLPRP